MTGNLTFFPQMDKTSYQFSSSMMTWYPQKENSKYNKRRHEQGE